MRRAWFCCFPLTPPSPCLFPVILLHPQKDVWAPLPIHLPPLLFVLLSVGVTCSGISCEDISGWGQRWHRASIKSAASESVRTSLAVTLRAEGDGRFILAVEDAVGRVWPPRLASAMCQPTLTVIPLTFSCFFFFSFPSEVFPLHSQTSQQMVKVTTVWYLADKSLSKTVNTLSRTLWFKLG